VNYYLAVDLGASSGKHLLARMDGERIEFEEIHRFKNKFKEGTNSLCWDVEDLFNEIIAGMKKCAKIGKPPSFVGIDTWGVDYVLLGDNGGIIGDAVSYRDDRTSDIPEKVFEMIGEEELYSLTGIQKQPFNTIFQLYANALSAPDDFQKTETLLMLPCYFNYLLTGIKANEYTIASTSGLVNAKSGDWDDSIIKRLGLRRSMFGEIKPAGTILGEFTEGVAKEVGFSATVVLPCAHDTASAVLAAPLSDKAVYLSSGTWSLMGIEANFPITSAEARQENFTNEGGYGGKFRFLKNIMGLWMLRSVRENFGSRHTYDMMSFMAQENDSFPSLIDVSDNRFLAPKSMVDEVMDACAEANMPVPQTAGEICAVIYHSLSDYYGKTLRDTEKLTGKKFNTVNMVGGGTRDSYLNSLTAASCGKRLQIGPTEATALGNISAQMLATGEVKKVKQIREIIKHSVTLGEYGYGRL